MDENTREGAAFSKLRDVALSGLEIRVLTHTGKYGIRIRFAHFRPFSIVRQWVESISSRTDE